LPWQGRPTGCRRAILPSTPELVVFPNWEAVRAYAEKDPSGSDLAVAVRMIDNYGAATVIRP
jgi:hypothetical protein